MSEKTRPERRDNEDEIDPETSLISLDNKLDNVPDGRLIDQYDISEPLQDSFDQEINSEITLFEDSNNNQSNNLGIFDDEDNFPTQVRDDVKSDDMVSYTNFDEPIEDELLDQFEVDRSIDNSLTGGFEDDQLDVSENNQSTFKNSSGNLSKQRHSNVGYRSKKHRDRISPEMFERLLNRLDEITEETNLEEKLAELYETPSLEKKEQLISEMDRGSQSKRRRQRKHSRNVPLKQFDSSENHISKKSFDHIAKQSTILNLSTPSEDQLRQFGHEDSTKNSLIHQKSDYLNFDDEATYHFLSHEGQKYNDFIIKTTQAKSNDLQSGVNNIPLFATSHELLQTQVPTTKAQLINIQGNDNGNSNFSEQTFFIEMEIDGVKLQDGMKSVNDVISSTICGIAALAARHFDESKITNEIYLDFFSMKFGRKISLNNHSLAISISIGEYLGLPRVIWDRELDTMKRLHGDEVKFYDTYMYRQFASWGHSRLSTEEIMKFVSENSLSRLISGQETIDPEAFQMMAMGVQARTLGNLFASNGWSRTDEAYWGILSTDLVYDPHFESRSFFINHQKTRGIDGILGVRDDPRGHANHKNTSNGYFYNTVNLELKNWSELSNVWVEGIFKGGIDKLDLINLRFDQKLVSSYLVTKQQFLEKYASVLDMNKWMPYQSGDQEVVNAMFSNFSPDQVTQFAILYRKIIDKDDGSPLDFADAKFIRNTVTSNTAADFFTRIKRAVAKLELDKDAAFISGRGAANRWPGISPYFTGTMSTPLGPTSIEPHLITENGFSENFYSLDDQGNLQLLDFKLDNHDTGLYENGNGPGSHIINANAIKEFGEPLMHHGMDPNSGQMTNYVNPKFLGYDDNGKFVFNNNGLKVLNDAAHFVKSQEILIKQAQITEFMRSGRLLVYTKKFWKTLGMDLEIGLNSKFLETTIKSGEIKSLPIYAINELTNLPDYTQFNPAFQNLKIMDDGNFANSVEILDIAFAKNNNYISVNPFNPKIFYASRATEVINLETGQGTMVDGFMGFVASSNPRMTNVDILSDSWNDNSIWGSETITADESRMAFSNLYQLDVWEWQAFARDLGFPDLYHNYFKDTPLADTMKFFELVMRKYRGIVHNSDLKGNHLLNPDVVEFRSKTVNEIFLDMEVFSRSKKHPHTPLIKLAEMKKNVIDNFNRFTFDGSPEIVHACISDLIQRSIPMEVNRLFHRKMFNLLFRTEGTGIRQLYSSAWIDKELFKPIASRMKSFGPVGEIIQFAGKIDKFQLGLFSTIVSRNMSPDIIQGYDLVKVGSLMEGGTSNFQKIIDPNYDVNKSSILDMIIESQMQTEVSSTFYQWIANGGRSFFAKPWTMAFHPHSTKFNKILTPLGKLFVEVRKYDKSSWITADTKQLDLFNRLLDTNLFESKEKFPLSYTNVGNLDHPNFSIVVPKTPTILSTSGRVKAFWANTNGAIHLKESKIDLSSFMVAIKDWFFFKPSSQITSNPRLMNDSKRRRGDFLVNHIVRQSIIDDIAVNRESLGIDTPIIFDQPSKYELYEFIFDLLLQGREDIISRWGEFDMWREFKNPDSNAINFKEALFKENIISIETLKTKISRFGSKSEDKQAKTFLFATALNIETWIKSSKKPANVSQQLIEINGETFTTRFIWEKMVFVDDRSSLTTIYTTVGELPNHDLISPFGRFDNFVDYFTETFVLDPSKLAWIEESGVFVFDKHNKLQNYGLLGIIQPHPSERKSTSRAIFPFEMYLPPNFENRIQNLLDTIINDGFKPAWWITAHRPTDSVQ